MASTPSDDAHNGTSSKSTRQRKETRRPDIAIYKPGQSRLGKRSEDDTSKSYATKDATNSATNTKGDNQSRDTSTVKSQKPKAAPHGDKGQGPKQPEQQHRGEEKDEGRSPARSDERKSMPREQRPNRDDKRPSGKDGRNRPDRHSNRSSGGNKGGRHSETRPEHDKNSGYRPTKETTGSEIRTSHQNRNAEDGHSKKESSEIAAGSVTEGKSAVGGQPPQAQREKRWHGPQGKRKTNKEEVKPQQQHIEAGGVSKQMSDTANVSLQKTKPASEPSRTDQTSNRNDSLNPAHSWSGKQDNRHAGNQPSYNANAQGESPSKGPKNRHDSHNENSSRRSKDNERVKSSGHGISSRQSNQDTRKSSHFKDEPNRLQSEIRGNESPSSQEAGANKSKQKKPDRPFYVSPKLAGSANQDESKVEEMEPSPSDSKAGSSRKHQSPVPSEDAVETMVFTSRKSPYQNWQQKNNKSSSKNVASQEPQREMYTLENNKKVAMKSLLDLQVSPPNEGASSKPFVTESKSQTTETRSKTAHSSKRYSARRSRQRYNSESSTGSDNSQFVDAVAAKTDQWDEEVERTSSRLENLGLKKELTSSHESVSSADSGKYSGTGASQKNKSQNQNLKKQMDSRKEAGVSRREKETKDSGKQVPEKGKLTVTFNSQVREVKISPEEERRGSVEEKSEDERLAERSQSSRVGKRNHEYQRESKRSSSESEQTQPEQTSKGGGLLRLPPKTSDPITIHSQHKQQQPGQGYTPIYDRHYAPSPQNKEDSRPKDPRGRHANRSLLWDPNKPQERPALASSKKPEMTSEMHFYDPEYDGSPQEHGFDPRGHFQPPGYGSYYPSTQHMIQPGMYPPQGFYPTMSWAEQVEAHNMNSQSQAQSGSPAAQIPNYQGNFPPLGSSPDLPTTAANPPATAAHPSSHSQSAALRILQDSVRYENSLNNAVSRRFHGDESVQKILKLSQELEHMYEQVIMMDLETCNKHNVEQLLWKSAYYQLIEALKRQESEEPGSYKAHLEWLLTHGNDFYITLLDKLQSTYNFRLETHTGLDPLHEEPRRTIKLALLSAQRCMIALGDIARYKELTNDTNNYGKARSWYLKAQHLAPRNGRPYNQLAILALYTRRKLDAVYYYMRSLAASNPFLTARESLMSLFEEVRRKVEHKEKAQVQAKLEKDKAQEEERRRQAKERGGRRGRQGGGRDDTQATRREIWIASDGSSHDGSELQEEEEEEDEEAVLRRIAPVEINKKFVLSLLNVHGKLFTKIGMEHFEFITDRLLKEFRVLLSHSPTPLTSTRLIQAMAINMFAAHNTETADQSPREDMRSLLQEQAIQLGLDMFGLLVNRCNQLLTEHVNSDTRNRVLLSEDLLELLPGVKVYADWLMCHPRLWNPPPCCTEKPYSASVDIWPSLAELLNTLKQIDTSVVQFVKKTDENADCQEILLPEDVQLSGFVPLLSLPLQPVYVPNNTDKMEAMDCVRVISLLLFGEYACGQETPLLAYDVSKNCYVSVAPESAAKDEVGRAPDQDDDDVIVEEGYYEENEEDAGEKTEETGGISSLRQKKEDLERRLQEQQQKQAQIQAAMESHRQQRSLEVEIRPLYLVPDTNCFIDHLTEIQALLGCRKYKLVVPLVVINELDGLAKGSRDNQYEDPSQGRKVQEGAEQSIACLEEKFEQRNKYLRALTSKGTVMDTIAYRSEEVDFKGCNDDLILKCCLHYVDDRARDFMPSNKDGPIRLYRDVVLLTNDRNLRVKALQQNVPVKDITAFTRWAKV